MQSDAALFPRMCVDPVTFNDRAWGPSFVFIPGDVVRLKSGGPLMTVEGRGKKHGTLSCRWFDPKDHSKGAVEEFRPALLVLASEIFSPVEVF